MKNVIAASALLVMIAGSAFAASNQRNERPDVNISSASTAHQERVNAKSLFSPKDLLRAGLTMNQQTSVTVFDAPLGIEERGNDN